MSTPLLLSAEHLTLGYPNTPGILSDLSFEVYERDFIGVIGPNGGGKTTLVRSLLGLLKPEAGTIRYFGTDGRPTRSLEVGYIPQQNKIDKQFPITVTEVVASGLLTSGCFRLSTGDKSKVSATLERVGMSDYAHAPIGALSGGQLQRVLLGRALVSTPRLLILDEPNTYVDKGFENRLYDILPELNKSTAIMIVSHDIGTLSKMVSRLFCINRNLHIHEGIDAICHACSDANALSYLTLADHGDLI